MPIVEARETVILVWSILVGDATYELTKDINISFDPDEMILKYVCWYYNGTITNKYIINSDLIDGKQLCSVVENLQNQPLNLSFKINKPVRGIYTFKFTHINSAIAAAGIKGDLFICLEFVRYLVPKRAG